VRAALPFPVAVALAPLAAAQTFHESIAPPPPPSVAHERLGTAVLGLPDLDGDARPEYAIAAARGPIDDPLVPGDPAVLVHSGHSGEVLFALDLNAVYGGGLQLAYVGDLDGDHVGELLVGEPDDGPTGGGQVEIFSLRTGERIRAQSEPTPGVRFGASVAGIGDVDGDGVDDYAIGGPREGPSERGAVWTISGKHGVLIEKRLGTANAKGFGHAVTAIGDVQSDGIVDLMASAVGPDSLPEGEVRIFTPTWGADTRIHWFPGERFGYALAGLDDVDADGVDDYAIGHPLYDEGPGTDCGRVVAHSGATGSKLWQQGFDIGHIWLGSSLARFRDVDQDGIDEILAGGVGFAGVYSGDDGSVMEMRWSFVCYPPDCPPSLAIGDHHLRVAALGNVSGIPAWEYLVGFPLLDLPDPDSGHASVYSVGYGSPWAEHGDDHASGFGDVVLAHPDAGGDGRPDVIVAAPHEDAGAVDGGAVRAYDGTSGALLWTRFGKFGEQLGTSLALVDDVDGDGVRDVAAGAPQAVVSVAGLSFRRRGKVEILSGRTGAWIRDLKGASEGERYGAALAAIGDADGDGVSELAVGAPDHLGLGGLLQHTGRISVRSPLTIAQLWDWKGTAPWQRLGALVAGPGDVDGDGAGDVAYLSPGTGKLTLRSGASGAWRWEQDETGDALAAIGDVNGDGLGDLGVGDVLGTGLVYQRSGLDGKLLAIAGGDLAGDDFGAAVAAAGDVDLDGVLDLAVGTPGRDVLSVPPLVDAGGVEIVLDPTAAHAKRRWSGAVAGGRLGAALAAGVDFDADGIPDLVAGEPGRLDGAGGAWALAARAIGTTPYGAGTPGCGGEHLLVASRAPEVGTTPVLRSDGGAAGAPAFLAIALAQDPAGTDYGLGFLVHVSPLAILANAAGASDGAGTAAFPAPIPPNPALAGLALFAQVLHAGAPGACGLPLGLSSSEGLKLVLQP
jgi:hypothetical protein